ncbi:unnamed protein product [Bursaphelenchus xylophilus]|uniref:(pine wood nematode) hypothetical protein n=1 Tax=Bursaphelenchus xylophilus TaxID=6326 RepID=A0A7I8XPG4_BURXY|nr:unnamed protein product [Bursaphelenchus xylophilus]CAG9089190.1 unnamed protein product [Bursaphelenchus xylophilus]
MPFSVTVDFKIKDLLPSTVGQASGQNAARTVQAEHPPAVAGSPLGAHRFGVPGGEGGLSIASPTSGSLFSRSSENSAGTSTLHGVPSIASYEEFEAYQAMMAQNTPEPGDEEKTKLRAKMEELIEENRQLLRKTDEMRKAKQATEALWLSEMERAHKAEDDLEEAQRAINELKTSNYRAGRKLEEAIRAKDEAMAELEKEKEEKRRLKTRLSEILRHAEADARPPRSDRSRSPRKSPHLKKKSCRPLSRIRSWKAMDHNMKPRGPCEGCPNAGGGVVTNRRLLRPKLSPGLPEDQGKSKSSGQLSSPLQNGQGEAVSPRRDLSSTWHAVAMRRYGALSCLAEERMLRLMMHLGSLDKVEPKIKGQLRPEWRSGYGTLAP